MRTFVSLPIYKPALLRISDFITSLSEQDRLVRWTRLKNIHLTLKFLGEVEYSKLQALSEKLRDRIANHSIFSISIRDIGGFPNLRDPRIIWIGIEKSEPLQKLFFATEEVCSAFGFDREGRAFSPHITIGRIKTSANQDLIRILKEHKNYSWGESIVDKVVLMKSILGQGGPEYSVISEAPLLMAKN